MEESKLATAMLEAIIKGDNFQDAIKAVFPNDSAEKNLQGATCALVGCVLRHYTLLKEVCKNSGLVDRDLYILYISLANNAFLKKYDNQEVRDNAKEYFGSKWNDELERLFDSTDDLIASLPELEVDSLDYISVRFNTPRWLVNMWQRHFGKAYTFRILRKNNRQQVQTVRVNTNKVSTADFLAAHRSEFELTAVEDVLSYTGKGQIRKTPFARNLEVFAERIPVKLVVDKVFDLTMGEALLITANNDAIVREMLLKSNGKAGINVAAKNLEARGELIKLQRVEKPLNMAFMNVENYHDLHALANNKQDLAVVYPESSSFDLIRQFPDYLLHFEHETIDNCLAKQKEALEGADEFLAEGSKLVYIVDTLNKKESKGTISNFLESHPNYELIEDRQYFPFDEYDTALYYAILLKKENTSND